ncbi:MAG TPA: DUF1684 domain-containing protein [Nocardioidaceae bacterium]|nr:DUF1684 domain-containing protein [Nocardioidaceae bacterium]
MAWCRSNASDGWSRRASAVWTYGGWSRTAAGCSFHCATTSGHTTYGGGRYLVDTVKGADLGGAEGSLVIDFNFAYNPSCAYDPAWACPLAPAGNVLDTAIDAGELAP